MASKAESLLKQPNEILEMVFDHLDDESSRKAALICPRFYEVICLSRRNKIQCLDLREKVN